jgi:hypothetical protein
LEFDLNIFYLSHDPAECAKFHADRHSIKMIVEYAQLLSTAHRVLDGTLSTTLSDSGRKRQTYTLDSASDSVLYTATHINHPSAIWVRQSDKNYNWLFAMFQALMDEYTYRYGKVHACTRLELHLGNLPKNIPQADFTEPTPAMPDDVQVKGDSIQSYKNYYIKYKQHLAKWSGKINSRPIPDWFHTT